MLCHKLVFLAVLLCNVFIDQPIQTARIILSYDAYKVPVLLCSIVPWFSQHICLNLYLVSDYWIYAVDLPPVRWAYMSQMLDCGSESSARMIYYAALDMIGKSYRACR
jgi:hypothetical protein